MSSTQPANDSEGGVKLFRKKALSYNQMQFVGAVDNSTPALGKFIAIFSLIFLLIIISFIFFGYYTVTNHVKGHVRSSEGLLQVSSSRPGVLTQLLVHEGESVSSGQAVAIVEGIGTLDDRASVTDEVIGSLNRQINSLEASIYQLDQVAMSESLINESEIKAAHEELDVINDKVKSLGVQLISQREVLKVMLPLVKDFAITKFQLEGQREKITATEIDLKSLKSAADSTNKKLSILLVNADKIEQKRDLQKSEITRESNELQRQRSLASMDRRSLVLAPVSGIVASIDVNVGEHIRAEPFLTILPGTGLLDIELKVPERYITYLNEGDQVWIRYLAAPYQNYGDFLGRVISIGQIPIRENLVDSTPHYKVVISADSLSTSDPRTAVKFLPGFQVEVALLGEQKKIVNWLFDPIKRSLTGH
ncbi:HlyD family secretion protein [Pseudomonas syringae]|uniref:HlyD family secretion protein n=1 Tax=Pseudomonas syringae TaxID=317 RepID=UPI000CDB18BE|nr:HlyD family efflux transporter periplasmic adaptor subunit [Pseudomonas syringae]POP63752.1 hypothetical protein CXB35_27520 [Pseudomonas syringae]